MGSALELNEHNFHEVTVDARRLLFHIPSSSLFEADANSSAVIAELRRGASPSEAELGQRLAGAPRRLPAQRGTVRPAKPRYRHPGQLGFRCRVPHRGALPLTTVVLNVNTGCNLSCTYCWEDLAVPSAGKNGTRYGGGVDRNAAAPVARPGRLYCFLRR